MMRSSADSEIYLEQRATDWLRGPQAEEFTVALSPVNPMPASRLACGNYNSNRDAIVSYNHPLPTGNSKHTRIAIFSFVPPGTVT